MKYKRPYMLTLAALNALPEGTSGDDTVPVYTVTDADLLAATITSENPLYLPLAVLDALLDAEAELLTDLLRAPGHFDRLHPHANDPLLGRFLFKQEFVQADQNAGRVLQAHIGSPVGVEVQAADGSSPWLPGRPGVWERVSRFAAGVNPLGLTTIKGLYAFDENARFFFVGFAARVWMVMFTRPNTPGTIADAVEFLKAEALLPDKYDGALVDRTLAKLQPREGEQLAAGGFFTQRNEAERVKQAMSAPVAELVELQRKGAL